MSVVFFDEVAEEVRADARCEPSMDEVVQGLREELARHRDRWARRSGWVRRWVPTGLAPLDAVLPGGGVPSGATVEIGSDAPGAGAMSLALRIAGAFVGGEACCALVPLQVSACGTYKRRTPPGPPLVRGGDAMPVAGGGERTSVVGEESKPVVWIDASGEFYPPAACAYGLSLSQCIVLRVRNPRDALWAMEQALRCSAVGAVVGSFSQGDERDSRRLQLAAEASGGVGLLLRTGRGRGKSFAALVLHAQGVPCTDGSRRCRITMESVREGTPAGPVEVDLHHETGDGVVLSVSGDRSVARTG